MSDTTARLGLYLPEDDGSEYVNVATDLNDNLEKLDVAVGFLNVTSSTRPAAPYNGQGIRETDTGKHYIHNGTVPASAGWGQVLVGTVAFDPVPVFANGVSASGGYVSNRTVAASAAFRSFMGTETQPRLYIEADGSLNWGPGASTAPDTDLYRTGANQLTTSGQIIVTGALNVGGVATLAGGVAVTGAFSIGTATMRPQLSTAVTLANSTTQTILGSFVVAANESVAGSLYKIVIQGLGSCTGTPTLTLRARVNGVAGNSWGDVSFAFASGITDHSFRAELLVSVISTGGSGSARGFLNVQESCSSGGTPQFTDTQLKNYNNGTAAVVMDTTAAQTLCITGQWSAASASNSLRIYYAECKRVA